MELVRRDADYAVRALILIAREGGVAQTARIAQAQEVPFDFLHKILRKLKNAGIVKVKRGARGGFTLSQPAQDIRLLSIIEAVQGKIAVNRCFLGRDGCPRQKGCPVHDRLEAVQEGLCGLLEEITLAELVGGKPDSRKSAGRK